MSLTGVILSTVSSGITESFKTNQVFNQLNCFSYTVLVSLTYNKIHYVIVQEIQTSFFIDQLNKTLSQ